MSKKADSSGIREGRSQTGIFSPGLLFKPTTVKKSNSPPHRGGDLYASTIVTRTTDEEAADPWFNPNNPRANYLNQSTIDFPLRRTSGDFSPASPRNEDSGRAVRFLSQEDWHNDFMCYNCKRPFNKLKGLMRHHCRICAKSVCGECSSMKIKEQRACDMCYVKSVDTEGARRRENFMANVDEVMRAKHCEVVDLESAVIEKDNEILKLNHDSKTQLDALMHELELYDADLKKHQALLQKKLESQNNLKGILKGSKELLRDRQKEFATLSEKNKKRAALIASQEANYAEKLEELKLVSGLKNRLEDRLNSDLTPYGGDVSKSGISYSTSVLDDSIIRAGNEGERYARSGSMITYAQRTPSILGQSALLENPKNDGGGVCSLRPFNCK